MRRFKETRDELQRCVNNFGSALRKENLSSLVLDGQTLRYALDAACRQNFLDVAISCKTVICCR